MNIPIGVSMYTVLMALVGVQRASLSIPLD